MARFTLKKLQIFGKIQKVALHYVNVPKFQNSLQMSIF